jgi:exopolyphosphatase/guanosine-5'-triphosphate,3'-diphosphate pyrophosphatase
MPVPRPPADETVAVIDIGSNSGRVVVYRLHGEGYLRILATARASLRLVREIEDGHTLTLEAVERTLEALQDFRAIARGAGARRTVALATAAVRDADNGLAFIRRVKRELGFDVRILSGQEEARFGFIGAVRGLPLRNGVLFDVGGGSMQVTRFRDRRLLRSWSFPIGALRLSDTFLRADPPSDREVRRLQRHVLGFFEDADLRPLRQGEALVGTGGTVRNLAKIDQRAHGYPVPRLHGYVLTRQRLDDVTNLVASRRQKKRGSISGLNDDRADSIVGGSLAIQTLADVMGAQAIHVSGQGVREGMAYSLMSREMPEARQVRDASVLALARAFSEWDASSARRRAAMADTLLRAMDRRAGAEIREALSHAATILDVGRSIDYFERHDHVADIVLATDLVGFSHREIALLSAIVRNAGDDGSGPKPYAPLLDGDDRGAIERAATILALADDIGERCPPRRSVSIRCTTTRSRAVVSVLGLVGWRPRRIGSRFQRVFGRSLRVVPRTR